MVCLLVVGSGLMFLFGLFCEVLENGYCGFVLWLYYVCYFG